MSPPCIDLHAHSTASDGILEPAALVARASRLGVDLLALTDHDTTGGLEEAEQAARFHGVPLVHGVEISVTWDGTLIHVLGLGITAGEPTLEAGLESLRRRRNGRGEAMAAGLASVGVPDPLAGALRQQTTNILSRTHFARHLVACGFADDVEGAIRDYLVPGKPGHVHVEWASFDEAVGWILAAGGVAVIAHPGRYGLDAERETRMVTDFMAAGGTAIEVVCGRSRSGHAEDYAELARRHDLRASLGSDFHAPSATGVELGRLESLPDDLLPVWAGREWAPQF